MKSKRAADIAQSSGTIITFKNQLLGATPALTDKSIQEKIVRATKSLNLTYKQMQSGAGHDSQDMADCTDRNDFRTKCCWNQSFPKEFSKAVDMANGANVLLQTILALDMD
jgi:N-carbamoyl-L-amino-acid hydrolase